MSTRPARPPLFVLLLLPFAAAAGLALALAGEPLIQQVDRLFDGIPHARTLASFFGDAASGRRARWSAPDSEVQLAVLARENGVDPALLKGFALALGCADEAAPLAPEIPPAGVELLLGLGESERSFATVEGRLAAIARALPELSLRLGSPEAALLSLVVGLEPVEQAAAALRARGREPTYERLLPQLPRRLRRAAGTVVPTALSLANAFGLDWPVASRKRISSGFGPRFHPVLGRPSVHSGVDIPMRSRTPVAATGDGTVLRTGEDRVNGRFVIVDHGRGVTSAYLHNDELLVVRGDLVARGQPVALSGSTGRSTGPHLHYQVELDGDPVDPLLLFQRGELPSALARQAPPRPRPKARLATSRERARDRAPAPALAPGAG